MRFSPRRVGFRPDETIAETIPKKKISIRQMFVETCPPTRRDKMASLYINVAETDSREKIPGVLF